MQGGRVGPLAHRPLMAGYCAVCPHGFGQHQTPDPFLIHDGQIYVWLDPDETPLVCVKHDECGCLGFVQDDYPWERRSRDDRIDKLGRRQSSVLKTLRDEGGWDNHAGWRWESTKVTRQILDSLVKRGYATFEDGIYRPADQSSLMSSPASTHS